MKKWRQAEENIQFIIDKWVKIIILVERYERRQQQISFDNGKFAEMLNGFSKLNTKIYPDNEDNNNSTRNDVNVNVVVDIMKIINKILILILQVILLILINV